MAAFADSQALKVCIALTRNFTARLRRMIAAAFETIEEAKCEHTRRSSGMLPLVA
jgi:hypothetical protein